MFAVGNTPMIRLGSVASSTLLAKLEYKNPTGSVKDRAAKYILETAVRRGELMPGGTVIEATSGNMGISLAACCAEMGCQCTIVMPDSMSAERQQRIINYGAQLVLTPGEMGMAGAVKRAGELARERPGAYLPRQFENKANVLAHYATTGPEIWHQTNGKVDIFVAGVGTGGTLTGTGRFLKEKNPNIRIVAVEPAASPVLSGGKAGSHGIQGIGAGFVPGVLQRELIDAVITVTDENAFASAKALAGKGILAGISSGAAAWAAEQIATENPGETVVTILPDSADRYGSLGL